MQRPLVTQFATAKRAMVIAAIYLLVALIVFQPWLKQFSSVLLGPPEDNLQDFWNVWYAAHTSLGSFFHTDALQFPYGMPLYFHSFSYPHIAAVLALTHWLGTDRETLIWLNNAALFASFPLAGFGAFFLVRRFVGSDLAALVGGFLFAFNPQHVAQALHHTHVTHVEFLPLFALAYLKGLDKKSLPWLVAASVFGALGALSCWYYMFYAAYFVAFHTLYKRWHDKEPITGFALKAPLVTLAGLGLFVSPLIIPMLLHSGVAGNPGGTDAFVADVEAFFVFPTSHIFSAWSESFWVRLHTWTSNNDFEGAVYLGLVNIAILAWLWRRRKTDATVPYVFWGMLVFGVLAMGDCIHIFGFDTLIPIPGIIPNHLPFFSQMRTPSRIMELVYLFLAIGVAHSLTLLAAQWRERAWGRAAVAAIAGLVVLDFAPVHLEFTDARCPAALAVIANDPETGFGVLNLPTHDEGDWSMFHQTCHGKPIVLAAITRSGHAPLTDLLDNKNFAVQRDQLVKAKVKYLILDDKITWEPERDPPRYAIRRWVIRNIPALGKMKGIAIPPYSEPIPKSAYVQAFPVVSRSDGLIVLKVR